MDTGLRVRMQAGAAFSNVSGGESRCIGRGRLVGTVHYRCVAYAVAMPCLAVSRAKPKNAADAGFLDAPFDSMGMPSSVCVREDMPENAHMNLDDEICYCYHVSMRKLINFSKRTKPPRPSQMTQCLNAGTGCGWCIPFLVKIAEMPETFADIAPTSAEDYAAKRKEYITEKKPRNMFQPKADYGAVDDGERDDAAG